MIRYFSGNYQITEESGVIKSLTIGRQRIPDGQIARHNDEINAVIDRLARHDQLEKAIVTQARILRMDKSAAQEQAKVMEADAKARAADAAALSAQVTVAQAQGRASEAAITQARISYAQARAAQTDASVAAMYAQSASSYSAASTGDDTAIYLPSSGVQTTATPQRTEVTITSQAPNSIATLQTGTDPNHSIIEDILKANLATDPNHLSFRLSRKSFSVNGVTQDKETTDRFIKKYVIGNDSAFTTYAYNKRDGQTSSSVQTSRK